MESSILAVRSVAVEFARRLFWPILITVAAVSVVLLALCIWLITINGWWVLLLIVIGLWVLIAAVALSIMWAIMRALAPAQSKPQKQQTKNFVDKLQRVAEAAGTPKFILFFQVFRDVTSSRKNGFIESLSNDTTSLKDDFINIKKSFES